MPQESDAVDEDTSLSSLVATVVTSLTLVVAFGLLAVGWPNFWVVFIIGFAGVLPLSVKLAEWYESRSESGASRTENDALDALREQYARGKIDEAEFERRVEALLETETAGDAEQFYRTSESGFGSESADTDVAVERERERERN